MNQPKIILYGLGIGLIIIGFLMIAYGEMRLNTPYMCPANGCNFSPKEIYQISTIPTIIAYSGFVMVIAGGICILMGRKNRS